MRYIGFCLVLLSAYLIIRRERVKLDGVVEFLEELSSLLCHIECRVTSYFESPREWAASFEAKDGEIATALDKIKHGSAPSVALAEALKMKKSLHGVREDVSECISGLGGDELCLERERIGEASERIKELASAERARAEEVKKIRSALFVLISLGAVIILI